MEKNLTSGSVWKNIVYFSLPYLLSYFLQTLYGMADLFIIGQFDGTAGTTAVSIGSQVMHMLTVMIVGLAMGVTVSIGQAVGANNKQKASKTIGNTVILFMLVSIVLTLVLVFLVNPIVSIMSTPQEAVAGTKVYLTICFIGIPCITAYNIISSIFRGLGDSKSPMYFIAVACVANIVLDYVFIGGMNLGPAGAALGTTLSQAISVIIALTVILKQKTGISIKKSDFVQENYEEIPVILGYEYRDYYNIGDTMDVTLSTDVFGHYKVIGIMNKDTSIWVNDNLVYLDRYIIAPALTIQQEPCDYSDLIYQGFLYMQKINGVVKLSDNYSFQEFMVDFERLRIKYNIFDINILNYSTLETNALKLLLYENSNNLMGMLIL